MIPTRQTYSIRENEISNRIIGCAIEAHRTLGGSGLLESVYEEALAWELRHSGMKVERQVMVPIRYKGDLLTAPLRLDLLVEDLVIVECKSAPDMHFTFKSQAMTYLRLSGLRLALVINFGSQILGKGIWRVANDLPEEPGQSRIYPT